MKRILLCLLLTLGPTWAQGWRLSSPGFPVWGQPGEVLEIELTGPKGQAPKLTVGPSGPRILLQEGSPGQYHGVFSLPQVGPRDLILHTAQGGKALGRVSSSPLRKGFLTTSTTVTRQGPISLYDRHTPAMPGTEIAIDGSRGDWHRAADSGVWFDGKTGKVQEKPPLRPNRVKRILVEKLTGGDVGLRFQCERIPFVEAVHQPDQQKLMLEVYAAHTVFDIKRPSGVAPFLGVISTRPGTRPETVQLEIQAGPRGIGGYSFTRGKKPGEFILRVRKPLPNSLKGLTITLDAGHGGAEDTGTVGHGGLPEKTLNLRVTKALAAMLKAEGANVVMTRENDLDLDLQGRVDLSEAAGSQLFLSLHHNARPLVSEGKRYHGTDIYWYQPQSQPLARALADPIADAIGESLRSSRYRSFYVARQTHAPAVLIEFQYLSNPTLEKTVLDQPDYPDKAAKAVVEGLKSFLATR